MKACFSTALLALVAAVIAMLAPTSALAAGHDLDRDGMPDRWEVKHGLHSKSVKPAKRAAGRRRAGRRGVGANSVMATRDLDRDGLTNIEEYRGRTEPLNADTDDDGVLDGDENGVVTAFKGGTLTVVMPGGKRISGTVDRDTLVFCEPDWYFDDDATTVDPSAPLDDAATVDPDSDPSFGLDTVCGAESIAVGVEVVYVDIEDGVFTDVTLNASPASTDGGSAA